MALGNMINKVRSDAGLSTEQFAEIFGVSRQSVQKWESGESVPALDKLTKIAKYFDISLDTLVLESDARVREELKYSREIKPRYENLHTWENYSSDLMVEYRQSIEEGLDVEIYKDTFEAVSRLPKGEIKTKLADALYEAVINAPVCEGYGYIEPNGLEAIRTLRQGGGCTYDYDKNAIEDKIYGAWLGRICGCLLGKTVEGIRLHEFVPFLKETGNYPMFRYIKHSEITDEICDKYKFRFRSRCYADTVDGMPVDDDTNYMVIAQKVLDKYGRDFTPYDVRTAWLRYQGKDAYCTAERVAYCNFIKGYEPPESAIYKNPYREWIGAQIRGDYFGYINPGDPEAAAEMAHRDASISHVKNGIYGEMFIAAMIAGAAATDDIEALIKIGLSEIPHTSRLYERITRQLDRFKNGVSEGECFGDIFETYDDRNAHDWCLTVSNAEIVTASLLYGGGDYGRSICLAVQSGFDTDCNGATVGSIIGMAKGSAVIGEDWIAPIRDTLHTSIFGYEKVSIRECAKKTMEHLK